jgi:hypothetical protein
MPYEFDLKQEPIPHGRFEGELYTFVSDRLGPPGQPARLVVKLGTLADHDDKLVVSVRVDDVNVFFVEDDSVSLERGDLVPKLYDLAPRHLITLTGQETQND